MIHLSVFFASSTLSEPAAGRAASYVSHISCELRRDCVSQMPIARWWAACVFFLSFYG